MATARPERMLVKEILKFLLASQKHGGEERVLDVLYSLAKRARQSCRIKHPDDLERFLLNHSELFQVRRRPDDNVPFVTLMTSLGFCPAHSNRSRSCPDAGCNDLHTCIFYLLSGNCKFGRKCLFGHDISSRHNRMVLSQRGLAYLDLMELGQVLSLPWIRHGVAVPKVCTFYNQLRGCESKGPCRSFHLCLPHVQGKCKFNKRCKRNHDVTHPQVAETLAFYGVRTKGRHPEDILGEIRTYQEGATFETDTGRGYASPQDRRGRSYSAGVWRNRFQSEPDLLRGQGYQRSSRERNPSARCPSASRFPEARGSSYTSLTLAARPPKRLEKLCLFYLQDKCRYGEDCRYLHSDHPFLWQVAEEMGRRSGTDLTWSSLDSDDNIRLETYFSQPGNRRSTLENFDGAPLEVNFQRFSARSGDRRFKLRRIGTPSSEDPGSVGQSPSGRQTDTVWNWYWRDKTHTWNLFGLEDEGQMHLPWTSDRVERTFLTDAGTPVECGHFSLHFERMRLIDLDSGRQFKVVRRPQLPQLSDEDSDESDDESQSDCSDEESEQKDCTGDDEDDVQAVGDVSDDAQRDGCDGVPDEQHGLIQGQGGSEG